MKFTPEMYTDYQSALAGKYKHKMTIKPELGKLVTFSPAKNKPFHRWFLYKQGFSPEFVKYCIEDSAISAGSTVLDPFSGVGTTPYTAACLSFNAIGIDILPFSKFIGEAKLLDDYDCSVIRGELEKITAKPPSKAKGKWPDVKVITTAFDDMMARRIIAYKEHILNIEHESTRRFFLVCLIGIIDKLGKVKKDGGFLRKIETPKSNDIDGLFKQRVESLLEDLEMPQQRLPNSPIDLQFQRPSPDVSWRMMTGDVRKMELSDSSVELIVTSPPYLNKTDYTRVYSLELCLHFVENFEQLRQLRYDSIRGNVEAKYPDVEAFFPEDLIAAIDELKQRPLTNNRHPEMIKGYFEDMYLMLKEFFRVLKCGGQAYIANWNARFSGIMYEVDSICAEMAEYMGFEVQEIIIVRLKGSSTQQVRLYGETAVRESVLVIKKKIP